MLGHNKSSKERRTTRVRTNAVGTRYKPRLSVFRSNKYTYAQLIDDKAGKTLATISTVEVKDVHKGKTKTQAAFELGKVIARHALDKQISQVVFDRGPYRYHGRVKSLADGAREGGLTL